MPGGQAPTRERARALFASAVLSDLLSENVRAEQRAHEACAIYRQFGDTRAVATVMVAMAWQAQRRGRYAEATALFEETVLLWEQLGDAVAADLARSNTATTAKLEGDFGKARGLLAHVAARLGDARRRARRRRGAQRARRRRAVRGRPRGRAPLPHSRASTSISASGIAGGSPACSRTSRASTSTRPTTPRPRVAHAGAAGLSRAGTPARRGPPARDAVVVRQPASHAIATRWRWSARRPPSA